MPPITLPEVKNISVALALAITIFTLGWSTREWSDGINRVKERQARLEQNQALAYEERKAIWVKIAMIDRIGDALDRIEKDLDELKKR